MLGGPGETVVRVEGDDDGVGGPEVDPTPGAPVTGPTGPASDLGRGDGAAGDRAPVIAAAAASMTSSSVAITGSSRPGKK